jgi:hypothetical protein
LNSFSILSLSAAADADADDDADADTECQKKINGSRITTTAGSQEPINSTGSQQTKGVLVETAQIPVFSSTWKNR